MEAKELRIGNIIEFEGKLCTVKEIDEQGVKVLFQDEEIIWIDLFQFSPIPLTEEWLIKLGFEKFRSCRYKHKALIGFHITKGIGYYMTYVEEELQYVHQLQNLIFALTGSELKVNL